MGLAATLAVMTNVPGVRPVFELSTGEISQQSTGSELVVLIRSDGGDVKMMVPHFKRLNRFSSVLASFFDQTRVDHGQLPVLRGYYDIWDHFFTQISTNLTEQATNSTIAEQQLAWCTLENSCFILCSVVFVSGILQSQS